MRKKKCKTYNNIIIYLSNLKFDNHTDLMYNMGTAVKKEGDFKWII